VSKQIYEFLNSGKIKQTRRGKKKKLFKVLMNESRKGFNWLLFFFSIIIETCFSYCFLFLFGVAILCWEINIDFCLSGVLQTDSVQETLNSKKDKYKLFNTASGYLNWCLGHILYFAM
jgi:hypothetical protein